MTNKDLELAACFIATVLAVGCSSVRTYSNSLPPNLHIVTRVDSGSGLNSTIAELDIHQVNERCETEYQGRVFLESGISAVGIPVEQTVYLDFIFASKAFLSPNISATRFGTLLTPRPGHEYSASVNYDNGIYDVTLREGRKRSAASRVVVHRALQDCKPGLPVSP
ncbi:MAG TPA: hypothetical protein VGL10_04460 [Gammaproteobacteria bacterium]